MSQNQPIPQLNLPLPIIKPDDNWQIMELVADFHLNSAHPKTVQIWSDYILNSTADAIFLLGDIFDAWVGDDAALKGNNNFLNSLIETLKTATSEKTIYYMHGNRDFLVGENFLNITHLQFLADPTILQLGEQQWLLSHGDVLCIDDHSYMNFRRKVRNPQWQQKMLKLPLFIRQLIAKFLRYSSKKKQLNQPVTDVNNSAAMEWLTAANCQVLLHGHTHHPAEIELAPNKMRIVLSDWEFDEPEPRSQIFRLTRQTSAHWNWQRLPYNKK